MSPRQKKVVGRIMYISLSIWLWSLGIISFACKNASAKSASNFDTYNYRLPNDTYPEQYDLKLTTNVHKGLELFQGEVFIDIAIASRTRKIVLHARQLNISKATVTNKSTKQSEELSYGYEAECEFLILKRKNDEAFAAKTKWQLKITYNGRLRTDNRGFYMSEYIDDAGNSRYLAATNFEGTGARYAFPCYDEPDKRANFTLTINHSPIYTGISNMPIDTSVSSAGKTVFLTTPRMSTFTVAFVVCDFEYSEREFNGLTQRVYSRSDVGQERERALVFGITIVEYLSDYFGTKYMLPKLDHVALPDPASAEVSGWGLITYRESGFIYNETRRSSTKMAIALNIGHEIIHQWLGSSVTIKWWSDYWLKEALANLLSYTTLDSIFPEWKMWERFHLLQYNYALDNERYQCSEVIGPYVEKPEDIENLFSYFLHSKSTSILHMWHNALTDSVFQKALHLFLTKNENSATSEDELFTLLQDTLETNYYNLPGKMTDMIHTWAHQSGYPILTVTRNYNDGTFTIKQEPFKCPDEDLKPVKNWYVPFNYATATDADFHNTTATHYLLNVNRMSFRDVEIFKNDWLILNKQSTGYYRINYDTPNWNLIAESLVDKPFSIHQRNRAQLIYDADYFSDLNRLDPVVLLKLLSYLKQEDTYLPWSIGYDIIAKLNRRLKGHEKYDHFKFFVADLVRDIYKKVVIDRNTGEQDPNIHDTFRELIATLACGTGVKECLQANNNELKLLVEENIILAPNMDKTVCDNLQQAGDKVFNIIHEKLMSSTNKDLRQTLIANIGCTKRENQLKKFIYSSIDQTNGLRAHERYTLLESIYGRGEMGFMACIDFLHENWQVYDDLKRYIGGSNPLIHDILRMAFYVRNENQRDKLLALVATLKSSDFVTNSLEESMKRRINKNFEWFKKRGEPIMAWLSQYRKKNFFAGRNFNLVFH